MAYIGVLSPLDDLHGSIFEIGLRITLLGVNEDGELGRVAKEEDGGVVEDPVPVALLGIEFDREAARISGGVRRTLLAAHGREASNALGLLPNTREHVHICL